jgi:peroxiredoxin
VLSDRDRTTARAYGVLRAGVFPGRQTFVIGKDGRILDIDPNVSARSAGEDLVARLAQLGIKRV